jgi:hypothetical protein
VTLGNPNGAAALKLAGNGVTALHATVAANAETFARDLAPILADIRAAGQTSRRAIAAELTALGIQTRRAGTWQVSNVSALLKRCGPAGQ